VIWRVRPPKIHERLDRVALVSIAAAPGVRGCRIGHQPVRRIRPRPGQPSAELTADRIEDRSERVPPGAVEAAFG